MHDALINYPISPFEKSRYSTIPLKKKILIIIENHKKTLLLFFCTGATAISQFPRKGWGSGEQRMVALLIPKTKFRLRWYSHSFFFLKVRSQFISVIICFSLIFVVKSLEKKENLKKDKMIIIIITIIIIIIIIIIGHLKHFEHCQNI